MFKGLTTIAAKVAATAATVLALAVGAGATASSADAATCIPGSGTAGFNVGDIRYCYVGRTFDSTGTLYSDSYTTYVWNNGVSGTLHRVVRKYSGGWYLYGCYRTNPGFSGWVICPF